MNAVFFLYFFGTRFGGLPSDFIDFFFNLCKNRHLFEKTHFACYSALDINFLIKRVEVAAHFFIMLRVFESFGTVDTSAAD